MIENAKEFNKLTSELEAAIPGVQKQIDNALNTIKNLTQASTPQLIKEVTISEHKAKVTLYSDHAIRIEFEDKAFAEKYYQLCQ
jgi:flagellar hook-basal body complex protein FliE